MKRPGWFYLLVALICAGLLPVTSVRAQPELIVVGNDAPPYRIIRNGEFSGIYVDTLQAIAERIGVRLRFIETPFPRALLMMKQGTSADIMLGPNRTPEREEYMIYTSATFPREDKAFYLNPNTPDIRQYEDLLGFKITVKIGQVYFTRFDQDLNQFKEAVSDYAIGINKVIKGRNDLIIMPEQQGDWLLKQMGGGLKKATYKVEGNLSYITLSRQSQAVQYQRAIEDAMQQLEAEGVIDEILARYR